MKKNTLLYLDESLVKRAKKYDLNISKIAEGALRSKLPPMGAEEALMMDFWRHLEKLEEDKECFVLPFEIKSVYLKNIGAFKDTKLKFKKFNVITGACGTGKTTILKSIAYAIGHDRPDIEDLPRLIHMNKKNGSIDLEIKPLNKLSTEFSNKDGLLYHNKNTRCIIINDAVMRLDKYNTREFLKFLRKQKKQVIMNITNLEGIKLGKDINLIKLKYPKVD